MRLSDSSMDGGQAISHDLSRLRKEFEKGFGKTPSLYRAPGRVNLIGEHTDYNEGFVMPCAINLYCHVAIAARSDRQLIVRSLDFGDSDTINLDRPPQSRRGRWSDYVVGTALALEQAGHRLRGAELLISGEVPLGSGLSSSAAIEVATGFALLNLAGISVDRVHLAMACRHAENEFVGARVGIMDQFISANGEAGHSLLLDCRSLTFEMLPIPEEVQLVVCNTGVRHNIAAGEYNQRREQCEEGVRLLKPALTAIHSLRDVSSADLSRHRSLLPELIFRRCRHVVTEDERVQAAASALKTRNLARFGTLMAESHQSLRFDYEVSCEELDTMVEIAMAQEGIIGARMTGGGFGGCTVNLVRAESAELFKKCTSAEYERRTRIHPDVYILSAANGAHNVSDGGSPSDKGAKWSLT